MHPAEQLRGSDATRYSTSRAQNSNAAAHCAPPCRNLLGLEPALRSLPYSLAVLQRQEQEVKGIVTKFSLGREPSSLFKMDLKGSHHGREVVRGA